MKMLDEYALFRSKREFSGFTLMFFFPFLMARLPLP
jgi:hypothetical protein